MQVGCGCLERVSSVDACLLYRKAARVSWMPIRDDRADYVRALMLLRFIACFVESHETESYVSACAGG